MNLNSQTTSANGWKKKLAIIVDTMREMSSQTDPQAMVRSYGHRMRELLPTDCMLSLSRRGLSQPRFRITRYSRWAEERNPWKEKDRLPLLEGGLLADLLYGDVPQIIDEIKTADDDPAREYLTSCRSLVAIPHYDGGAGVNMVILMREQPAGFDRESFPELVWMSNLFGRATHNLVLTDQLREAYEAVDNELMIVAGIQRSLLPARLPDIPGIKLAAYYQTSRRAGGDYYDFFPLPDGRLGILIADVSGHGTPAAVVMAVTHSIAHAYPGPPDPPGKVLNFVNRHLTDRYTSESGAFVTAFYGIYDPKTRIMQYACAGHNPPRLKGCPDRQVTALDGVSNLPLGISDSQDYSECRYQCQVGDQLIFYTDGITEASDPLGELFGSARLDAALSECHGDAQQMIDSVLGRVEEFTGGLPPSDDRTMLVAIIGS